MSSLGSFLRRPLFGVDPRLTALAIGYGFALSVLVGVSGWRRKLFLSDGTMPPAVDFFSWLVILLAVLTTTLVPLGYALWNGGPATALFLALAAHLSAGLVSGQLVADVDFTIALAVGALAATVAVFREAVHRDSLRSPAVYPGFVDGLLVGTVPAILAAVGIYRLAGELGGHASLGFWLGTLGTVLAVAGLTGLWVLFFHKPSQSRQPTEQFGG